MGKQVSILYTILCIFAVLGCRESDNPSPNTTPGPAIQTVSLNGTTFSHADQRRGQDCIGCHTDYVIAGTVYDFGLDNYYADAKIHFYNQPDGGGNLVQTLEVDGYGNFFTTEDIGVAGLYPVLENAAGDHWDYMPNGLTDGSCNSCHGVSNIPIYVGEQVNSLISQHGTTNSHTDDRRGQDCLSCHYQGNNEYVYTLAGTVYQQADQSAYFPNATLKFYTKADGKGELVATIEVDANGNYYTTETIDFGAGLYPSIEGGSIVAPLYMPESTTNGGCNSCHTGVDTARIVAPGEAVQVVSTHGTTFSHTDGRRGVDCLGCHYIGGDNKYQYSVAGTVYDISLTNFYPDATISLYSGPGKTGTLVATLEVDGNGNFYTTEPIDLGNGQGNGIYASILGTQPTSTVLEMQARTNNGGCSNSTCHGVTRPPIYAD